MPRYLNIRKIILFLGDVGLAYVSLFLTVLIGFYGSFSREIFIAHLLPFTILYFFWLVIFFVFGLYELNLIKTRFDFYPRLFGASIAGLAVGMVFFYLVPLFTVTPKTNLVLNVALFGFLAFVWRKLFYFLFASLFLNRAAILGKSEDAKTLAQEIGRRPYVGYKMVAMLDESDNLLLTIQEKKIDTLILDEALGLNFNLIQNLYQCLPTSIELLDLAVAYEIVCEKIPVSSVDQNWFLEYIRKKDKELYGQFKDFWDAIFSLLLLIISLPLWLLIAICVKLEDRGPVFYSQERVGKNRRVFRLRKFRSMRVNAEKSGPVWAKTGDTRVTKVGRIIRRLHLDELPQMINILKGELSLVGPRPERPEFVEQLAREIPYYHLRHLIKPGFTGWAQIKFRYARSIMDSREKFQYDLYYLKNRSLLVDIGVMLKTIQLLIKKD